VKYDRHIEDNAALYALGALTDAERAEADEHIRECPACAKTVGQAEDDVARIVASEPQRSAPPALEARIDRLLRPPRLEPVRGAQRHAWQYPAWAYPMAIAAALILGLLPSVYFWSANRSMHGTIVAQNDMMGRLIGAPHRMAHFRSSNGSSPADVMYAPDGSWYVVVVRDAAKPLAVVWPHDGAQTMLGDAVPKGSVAMLYLPKSHRMDRLALMDGDRVVGEATLSWQS
jgi:anti-sigma factor RsiW